MISWLNNPWLIGIGGGILSGLVVMLLSRYLLSRRENREYLQKVAAANQEIIYAIRPGISEGVFPTHQVLGALSAATARKHGVDKTDLFTPPELAQELMKEVMDSSFLSASDKQGYCAKLVEIERPERGPTKILESRAPVERAARSEIAQYRERMTSLMSMMMGMVAGTTTAFMAFFFSRERDLSMVLDKLTLFVPAVLAIMGVAAGTMLMFLQKQLRERHEEKRTEPERTDSNSREEDENSPKEDARPTGQPVTPADGPPDPPAHRR